MRFTVGVAVAVAAAACVTATAHAGVEDDGVESTSPVTGASYVTRYSCASGELQSVFRSDSGRWNLTERTVRTPAGTEGGGVTGWNGFALDQAVVANVRLAPRPSEWEIRDALGAAGTTDPITPYVTVAGGSLTCPDYAAPQPSVFVPLVPQRVLDTRPASRRNHAGGKPRAESSLVLDRSQLGDVPLEAVAVSATLTVTEADAPGFAQLVPGEAVAGRSSNVNPQFAGQTLANNAVSPVDMSGVKLFTKSSAHLLLDVNGYFVPAPQTSRAGRYRSMTPTRILDTRPDSAVNHSGGPLAADSIMTVSVAADAGLDPERIEAVAVNVTATRTAGPGYIQVAPASELVPGSSSVLNWISSGDTAAAFTIVPVSPSGEIDVYSLSGTDVIIDVVGSFTSPSAAASRTGRFVALTPERVLDTRANEVPVNCCVSREFDDIDRITFERQPWTFVEGPVGFVAEAGASDVFVNLTLVTAMRPGYLQAGAYGQVVPGAHSNVNAATGGITVANAAILGLAESEPGNLYSSSFDVYTASGGHVLADLVGYFTG